MFKRFFVFFSFFLLAFSLLFAFFYFKGLPKSKNQEIPQETPRQKEIGEKAVSQAIPLGENTFLLEQGPKESKYSNPEFSIYFYQDTGEYKIALLKNPIEETQKDAEQAFVERILKLGLKKEDACSLFVTVGTIASVNPDLAGRNLGLSFCKK